MHKIIRILIYANDQEEAKEKGKDILDRLTECQDPYDYHVMFGGEDDKGGMSGTSRWGEQPQAVLATSIEGKNIIKKAMDYTLKNLVEAWGYVKVAFDKGTPEEYFEHEFEAYKMDNYNDDDINKFKSFYMIRHMIYNLSYPNASNCWLYDQDGSGILRKSHLNNVLNKWKCINYTKYDDMNIYVISADVHY